VNIFLAPIARVLICCLLSGSGAAIAATVLENVQVNQTVSAPFPINKQVEPTLAQNPLNPLNVVVGAWDQIAEPPCTDTTPSSCPFVPGFETAGFYASFDGGLTWPCQGVLHLSAINEYSTGDPWMVFDSRGNLYYATGAKNVTSGTSDLVIAKSIDGGCHFGSAVKLNGAAPAVGADKATIGVDANLSSPFRGNLYATWTAFTPGNGGGGQIVEARSTDGGATWSNPLPLSPAYYNPAAGGRQGALVKVGPDGTVYVFWLDTVNKQWVERVSISHDGGVTFPNQTITAAYITDDSLDPLPGSSFTQLGRIFPSVAIAPNGTIYLTWGNHIGGHGVVQTVKSADGGLTWSAPVTAADVHGRSAFFSSISSDPNGSLNIVFLALDDVPFGTSPGSGVVHYDAYLVQSSNGGASFSAPLLISTASSDPDGSSGNGLLLEFIGDYISNVSDSRGSQVFAVWTDSRNALPCAAVDAFRAGTSPKPNVIRQCPEAFGNTDIVFTTIAY
jgi:hypothetical protein